MTPGGRNCAVCRSVDEAARDACGGIQLGGRERGAGDDCCRGCPANSRGGLGDHQGAGGAAAVVCRADGADNGIVARCRRRCDATVVGEAHRLAGGVGGGRGALGGAVVDLAQAAQGDRGGGLVYGQGDAGCGRIVVGGGGRCEGDRQGLGSGGQNRAGSRGVDEAAGNARGGLQLGGGESRAVVDRRGSSPGDDRGGLIYREGDAGRGRIVVGGGGRGKGYRQGTGSDGRDRAGRRGIGEGPGYTGRGAQLGGGKRGTIADRRRCRPGNSRGGLGNNHSASSAAAVVGGADGADNGVAPHCSRGSGAAVVGEADRLAGRVGGGRGTLGCAVIDLAEATQGYRGCGFVHRQCDGGCSRVVTAQVGRGEGDRQCLTPDSRNRTGGRGVGEAPSSVSGGFKLGGGKRRAVSYCCRSRPANGRGGLGDYHGAGRAAAVVGGADGADNCVAAGCRRSGGAAVVGEADRLAGRVGGGRGTFGCTVIGLAQVPQGECGYSLVNGQVDGGGDRVVGGSVGRGEADRQGLGSGAQDGAGSRGVDEAAGNARGGFKLCGGKRRAVSDRRGSRPGDGRGGFTVDREGHALRGAVVVDGVGGGEGDRQGLVPGGRNCTASRSVDETARNVCGGVQLGGGERCAGNDRCRGRPGDSRGGLGDRHGAGGAAAVVGGVNGADNGVAAGCCRSGGAAVVGEADRLAGRVGGGRGTLGGAVIGLAQAAQGERGDGLVHRQENAGRGSIVDGGVGRGEDDRQGLSTGDQERAGSGGVGEGPGNAARHCCIELGDGKDRAVVDRCRRRPVDDRGGFAVDCEAHAGGCVVVTRTVGRCEGDRQGLATGGGKYGPGGRGVDETAGNTCRGVQLSGRKCRADHDRCRSRPGYAGRLLCRGGCHINSKPGRCCPCRGIGNGDVNKVGSSRSRGTAQQTAAAESNPRGKCIHGFEGQRSPFRIRGRHLESRLLIQGETGGLLQWSRGRLVPELDVNLELVVGYRVPVTDVDRNRIRDVYLLVGRRPAQGGSPRTHSHTGRCLNQRKAHRIAFTIRRRYLVGEGNAGKGGARCRGHHRGIVAKRCNDGLLRGIGFIAVGGCGRGNIF